MELVACSACGREMYRYPEDPDRECVSCWTQRTGACGVNFRVDDWENVGSERTDATHRQIISLPNIRTEEGRDARGKMHYSYRPPTIADVPSRRAFLDAAKRAGLSPADGGRYRTVGAARR